jgi:hypothetical protein
MFVCERVCILPKSWAALVSAAVTMKSTGLPFTTTFYPLFIYTYNFYPVCLRHAAATITPLVIFPTLIFCLSFLCSPLYGGSFPPKGAIVVDVDW